MSVGTNIEVANVKEVKKFIDKKSKNAIALMHKSLARAAIFMQGEVKTSIAGQRAEDMSVDTGRFLNSVGVRVFGNDAEVYSELSYAKSLEFGLGKFKGRRHFNNSKDRNKKKVAEIFKKEINKI